MIKRATTSDADRVVWRYADDHGSLGQIVFEHKPGTPKDSIFRFAATNLRGDTMRNIYSTFSLAEMFLVGDRKVTDI